MTTSDLNNDDEYERVLLVKPTVYVYRIPPLTSASRGFRAADWNLSAPDWTGRLRVITKGDACYLRIEDSSTGQLYCQAPVNAYPGPQVQQVVDSRRYFVVKVVSDTGRSAIIGLGFADGSDSFDLNVALQDHFATLQTASESSEVDADRPKLDLSLKGDIKLSLNIGGKFSESGRVRAPKAESSANATQPFVLPPPPASRKR